MTMPWQPAERTRPYAVVPGQARDTFLFYHERAVSRDTDPLWNYARFCVSNLVWVNDHFIVTPNPTYLQNDSTLEGRHERVIRVLLSFYSVKRLVTELPTNDLPPVDTRLLLRELR